LSLADPEDVPNQREFGLVQLVYYTEDLLNGFLEDTPGAGLLPLDFQANQQQLIVFFQETREEHIQSRLP
jgi:hypothetical protein